MRTVQHWIDGKLWDGEDWIKFASCLRLANRPERSMR